MATRIVEVNIGDWSRDGHNQFDRFIIELTGDDLSDETLAANYTAASERFAKDLVDVCAGYDDYQIEPSYYTQLLEAGFEPSGNDEPPVIMVKDTYLPLENDEDEPEEASITALDLLMFYVGGTIPNFSWRVVKFPLLIGGFGGIVKQNDTHISSSFGYGLYAN